MYHSVSALDVDDVIPAHLWQAENGHHGDSSEENEANILRDDALETAA